MRVSLSRALGIKFCNDLQMPPERACGANTANSMSEVRRADRLRAILRRRATRRRWDAIIALVVVLIAVAVPFLTVSPALRWWQAQRDEARSAETAEAREPAIVFPNRASEPLIIHADRWDEIGLKLAEVCDAPPPPPLKLDGVLYLDPDDYSLVRSRFQGEVVEMPHATAAGAAAAGAAGAPPSDHSLRFGDDVKKGQLLAVIWSRELGEKKRELAEAL
jgi:cobalt-zinc-cadmium efflux system membrane fusion protein